MRKLSLSAVFISCVILLLFTAYYWNKLWYDPYFRDDGLFIASVSGGMRLETSLFSYGSFFNIHWVPFLSGIALLGRLFSVEAAVLFSVYMGATHVFGVWVVRNVATYGRSYSSINPRERKLIWCFAVFAGPLLSSAGISITYPHFEYLPVVLASLILTFSAGRRNLLISAVLFASVREDYALMMGLAVMAASLRGGGWRSKDFRFGTGLILYSFVALAIRFSTSGVGSFATSIQAPSSASILSENLRHLIGSYTSTLVIIPFVWAAWCAPKGLRLLDLRGFRVSRVKAEHCRAENLRRDVGQIIGLITIGSSFFAGIPQVSKLEMHYGAPLYFATVLICTNPGFKARKGPIIGLAIVAFAVLVPWRLQTLLARDIVHPARLGSIMSEVTNLVSRGVSVHPSVATLDPQRFSESQLSDAVDLTRQCIIVNPASPLLSEELKLALGGDQAFIPGIAPLSAVGACHQI